MRAITSNVWKKTLNRFAAEGTKNEKRMARIILDLLVVGEEFDLPQIARYFDQRAANILDETDDLS